jgi:dCMP deaminase
MIMVWLNPHRQEGTALVTWFSAADKWDRRMLKMAKLVASWSKDPSTQTGAVIARPDRTIASVGYNGFPRGCDDAPALYADRETKYSRIVHCEMNAILSAREPMHGCTLYTIPFASCDRCAAHVIQAGIRRCVAPILPDHLLNRWGDSLATTRRLFRESGVELVEL